MVWGGDRDSDFGVGIEVLILVADSDSDFWVGIEMVVLGWG